MQIFFLNKDKPVITFSLIVLFQKETDNQFR